MHSFSVTTVALAKLQWSIHVNYAGRCSATAVRIRVVHFLTQTVAAWLGGLMKCHGIYLRNFIPHHPPRHEADNSSAVYCAVFSFLACLCNVSSHLMYALSSVLTPDWSVICLWYVVKYDLLWCLMLVMNMIHTTSEHKDYEFIFVCIILQVELYSTLNETVLRSWVNITESGEWGNEWEHIHGGWYYHPHSLSLTHTQTSALEFIRVKFSSVFRLWALITV